ncbi:MAG: MASE1 domain-containing protein [Planctomycetota bacterium]
MPAVLRHALQLAAFAAAMFAASCFREGDGAAVKQAVVWLPTGVAIAGVWLLGWRSVWVVAATVAVSRARIDYGPMIVIAAAAGSAVEALIGAWVLRALGFRGDFARLRDPLVLFAAATTAPLASIAMSALSRQIPRVWEGLPFYSGWDGWWRMNALGALTVVPLATCWLRPHAERPRWANWHEGLVLVAAAVGLPWAVTAFTAPSPTAIMLLFALLPVALVASLRRGPRSAIAVAAAGVLFVVWATTLGMGPFQCVPIDDRHAAAQVFALLMMAVPLVIGSLIAEREAGRTRLVRSELARESLLRVLPDVAYRIGVDGRVLDVMAPDGVALPQPREAAIGQPLFGQDGSGLGARLQRAIATARRGGPSEPVEFRVATPRGKRVHEARCVRVDDQELLVVVRDITERQRAQQLLAWQAEMLERIATDRPDQEIFEALVRGLERFLEPGKGSLLLLHGQRLHHGWAPSLPPEYSAAIEGIMIGPDVGSCGAAVFTNRVVVAADTLEHANWARYRDLVQKHGLRACWSVPVRAPGGSVVGAFAMYYAQPRAPAEFEIAFVERAAMLAGIAIDRSRREGLLTAIHRNVKDGLYRSAQGQGLVYVNEAFARAFGYGSPNELLAAQAGGEVPPGPHAADLARFAPDAADPVEGEQQLRRRDGTSFWAMLSRTVVRDADGRAIACDGALTDITLQHDLAEQLRQAQKMEAIGKLAGGVAHDFNNLLTAITGYSEAIRNQALDAGIAADAGEILHAAERAAGLTRQLLAFSRQQVLTPQVVDLGVVVEGTAGMLRRLIGEHIRFVVSTHGGPFPVRVDKAQIEQVLMNLALNARDAMPDGGTLEVVLACRDFAANAPERRHGVEPGPHVVMAVRDTGVGMDEATVARAFEPFFTTKEQGKGTGLGLATVYGIMCQSGGRVWIQSEPQRGTTVWICLPHVAVTATRAPVAAGLAARQVGVRVLLAEDEDMVRDLVARILRRAGHDVVPCHDGREALAAAARPDRFDVLVTDTVMPNVGGRELAQVLWAERPGLPVLFLSGYASDGVVPAAGVAGAVEFLSKPFVADQLLDAVGRLVANIAAAHG